MNRFVLAFFSTLVFLCGETTFADDGFSWGAGPSEVKSLLKVAPKRETVHGAVTYLILPGTLAGESISVVHRFIEGKLFESAYVLESRGRECRVLSAKFNDVLTELTAKHGAPIETVGDADTCNTERRWDLSDTSIVLGMSTMSGRTDLSVVYQSKNLAKLAEQVTVRRADQHR